MMKTKFNLKTLLVIAILLISMCLFNTNMVQATDVKADETKKTTDTTKSTVETKETASKTTSTTNETKTSTDTATETKETTTTEKTTKTQKITPNGDTLKLIPDTMNISFKEIEFQKLLLNDGELKTAIMEKLNENNIDMSDYNLDLMFEDEIIDPDNKKEVDIHKVHISIYKKDNYSDRYEKIIIVKYSNTDKYNENDGKTIKQIADNIYWHSYTIDEYKNSPDVHSTYEKDIKELVKAYDKDIQCTIDFRGETGMSALGNEVCLKICYFKNDVFYKGAVTTYSKIYEIIIPDEIRDNEEAYSNYITKWIMDNVNGYKDVKLDVRKLDNRYEIYRDYGDGWEYECFVDAHKKDTTYLCDNVTMSINENVSLSATTIGKNSSTYTEMQNKLKEKGYTDIFNAYELKLTKGKFGTDGLTLNFDLGTENNGKRVIVLHKKADGTYEEFEEIVENGRIKVIVTELSPFMIALKDNKEANTQTPTKNPSNPNKVLDDEPKTRYLRLYNICKYNSTYFIRWNSSIKI